ncbi:hypothetical protein EV424DRAFT_1341550 [Suillus variegatus]|nr:hypothetical protein EV424DRAFT_1341550 [Suillus variegatus]
MATQATQRVTHARGKATSIHSMRGRGQASTGNISTASPSNTAYPTSSDTILGDSVIDTSSGIKIRWNIDLINTLVQFLSTHPANCRILFNEGGKKSNNEGRPSGSDKTKIYVVIMRCVFEKDGEYETLYSEGPARFMQAVLNHLTYLRNKYKKLHGHFSETGAEQVVSKFLWYKALNDIWKKNPAYAPRHSHLLQGQIMQRKGKHVPPAEAEDETMETTDNPNPTPTPNLTTSAGYVMDDDMMDNDEWDTGLGGQEHHASGKHPFTLPSPLIGPESPTQIAQ